ncbi:MAG: hypothetical protein UW07_C0019G0007 [Candidatus Nomurabacteria bacterium GW2011_GWF2_43_8]|uniref:YqaJ viral recombinase domain-containing protein n=3 Tax=Parcubacteria group TaxID=1794811 RepID=A0A0G1FPF6_9BACT|nr:MAG: hypothetical protein UW02_C0002G0027 [Candidatus Nomurabacteria bacterium GW2011_GWB1_43_7]KKT23928.1 MAG: hypothetical protein UW07_C0019G0007 [Candidatus Nomurabacteria bacterium GW2011_GWF2_43_8]KKU05043.1 MAG: hypothetical protein UX06_C0004G0011 [Candidatus Giovannonibacteria bacterium GW2011_GWA2_45_21]
MFYQEAENYIKETFYKDSYDSRSKLDIVSIINNKLVADNKTKDPEYFNHREGVVHSSSLYACLRGTIHSMLGTKKDNEIEPRKLGVFQAGNLFEEYVINAIGDKVVERQRQYEYKYKNITLVGRSDCILNDDGIMRIGECKSVHSDSFWHRSKEGTLIAWHNQIQLQIYMWLERELFGNNYDADLIYVSKDDVTVAHSALKYNPDIIEKIVKPALNIINEGYTSKNPNVAPLPPMVIFSEAKHQYQKNWLATYCEFHSSCAGAGWILEATNLVTQRNKELKAAMPSAPKKIKPKIEVVGQVEPPQEELPEAII